MDNLYASLESRYELPEGTLSAIQKAEGSGDTAVSPKGARGRFQFMPTTAEAYGVDPNDPVSSARGAAQYLSDLTKQYDGSLKAAIAHYNGGTKAGQAVLNGQDPPAEETRNYLDKVTSNLSIDPNQVKWNSASSEPAIDASKVQWNKSAKPETPSNTELFAKGVGASAQNTYLGLKQKVFQVEKLFDGKTAAEHEKQINEEIAKARQENAPVLSTTAGQLGNVAGEVAKAAPLMLIPGAGTVAGGAAIGGALGALQPTTPDESSLFNAGAGAVLGGAGQAVANTLGRVAQPFSSFLSETGKKAVKVLEDAGIPLDAAQKTGSSFLASVKGHLSDNPITQDAQAQFLSGQQKSYNRAIAKTMGENTDAITPDVIATAKERLGKNYDDVAKRTNIDLKHATQPINNLYKEATKVLNPTQLSTLDKNLEDIFAKGQKNGNKLDFSQYQNVKQTLDRLSASADTDLANYARDLKDVLKESLTKSVQAAGNKEDALLLKETNKQYGNMKKIEDVVLKNPEGDISPSLLLNSLATKAKRNAFFAEDKSLAQLASAGKQILPDKVPNSGTTRRLLAAALPGAVGGIGYGLYQGDLGSAAEGAVGGIMLPKLAQRMMNQPGAAEYLAKGIKPGLAGTPIRELLNVPKKGAQYLPQATFNTYLNSIQGQQ
jgi:hypothetical protein